MAAQSTNNYVLYSELTTNEKHDPSVESLPCVGSLGVIQEQMSSEYEEADDIAEDQ